MSTTTSTPNVNTAAETPQRSRPVLRIVVGLVVLALLLAAGILPRMGRSREAAAVARAAETERPVVSVAKPQRSTAPAEVVLPGNTEAVTVAGIQARASGYVRQRYVDIGTPVKAGQLLAVIESPEVDQELAAARADLERAKAGQEQARAELEQARASVTQMQAIVAQAQANEQIAGTTHQRWDRLVAKGVLPKQSGDERRSEWAARQADVAAAQASVRTTEANVNSRQANVFAAQAAVNAQIANVRRLERMQGFERVVAPFAGIVTERNIEQGDLVSAGAGARNLFSVAQARTLRIQVNVPQSYAVDVSQGQTAEVLVRERAGQTYTGTVARTAQALDSSSRTLLTEVQVDNARGELLPGMYAQVKFALPRSRPAVLVPSETLLVDAQGTRVVMVTPDSKVRFRRVRVGRDLGTQMEVLDGLAGDEPLVRNPADTLTEGQAVQVRRGGAGRKGGGA